MQQAFSQRDTYNRLRVVGIYDALLAYLVPLYFSAITVAFYLRTYDSAQIKITILQVLGTITVGLWLLKILEENVNPFARSATVAVPLAVYLALSYFSLAHSAFPLTTLDEFIRRNMYIFFSLIVITEFNSTEKIARLTTWILIAAFISTFYGIIQYLDYNYFPRPPERGLDPFIWRGAFSNRIFSTHGNPNFFGNFLVIVMPIILALLLKTRGINYAILFIMTTFCIYETQSKGAFLGYAAGFFIFVVLTIAYFPIGRIKQVKRVFLTAMVLILIVTGYLVTTVSLKRMDSLSFRVFTWLSTCRRQAQYGNRPSGE